MVPLLADCVLCRSQFCLPTELISKPRATATAVSLKKAAALYDAAIPVKRVPWPMEHANPPLRQSGLGKKSTRFVPPIFPDKDNEEDTEEFVRF